MRVCVIGAGLAGLAAADALAREDVDVVVIEGADRVGGRVWSERLPGGGLFERGGEFVTAGYEATAVLCARHGRSLCGMGIRYPDRELEPDPGLDRQAIVVAAEEVAAAAHRQPESAASAVLASAVSDPDICELFASRLQSALAFPFEALDARFLAKVPSLLDDLETRRIAGGNQSLAAEIGRSLGDRLHLGCRAEKVRRSEAGIEVRAGELEVAADACVVAVPCRLVAEIDFDPPLPPAVAAELAAIPMSTAAKLVVPLREPISPRAVMSVPHRFWAWVTPCDEVGGRVVGSWAGGEPVVDALDARSGDPRRWIERLQELWPSLPLDESGAVVAVWDRHSPSRGAYSVLRNEQPGPVDAGDRRVRFAGEHTAGAWSGTIEGAIRSGWRAAAELLANR